MGTHLDLDLHNLSSYVSCIISLCLNNLQFPVLIGSAVTNLRVEEDLRPQEAFVAHIDGELLLADGVDAGVLLDPLGAVCVVLVELFD